MTLLLVDRLILDILKRVDLLLRILNLTDRSMRRLHMLSRMLKG